MRVLDTPDIAALAGRLPRHVLTALNALTDAGFDAHIVGGCVRDMLMDKTPVDFDICTDATPDSVISALKDYPVHETGIAHGTVTAVIDKNPVEITTYRIDGEYHDYRRPEYVVFTRSLREDLSRRDFTINAMAYSPVSGFSDPFDGLSDLKNGVIRCVGDADKRFREDALRIMRAVRFKAMLGFSVENTTKNAILRHTPLLNNIAKERVSAELLKLLNGEYAADAINEFSCVMFEIIPELKAVSEIVYNNRNLFENLWGHIIVSFKNSPRDTVIRLALLLSDVGKPSCHTIGGDGNDYFYGHAAAGAILAGNILNRLRFDKKTKNSVVKLISIQDTDLSCDETDLRTKLAEFGPDILNMLIQMKISKDNQNRIYYKEISDTILQILNDKPCLGIKDLEITGGDIKALGVTEGKRIGEVLDILFREVLSRALENEKQALTERAKSLIG